MVRLTSPRGKIVIENQMFSHSSPHTQGMEVADVKQTYAGWYRRRLTGVRGGLLLLPLLLPSLSVSQVVTPEEKAGDHLTSEVIPTREKPFAY